MFRCEYTKISVVHSKYAAATRPRGSCLKHINKEIAGVQPNAIHFLDGSSVFHFLSPLTRKLEFDVEIFPELNRVALLKSYVNSPGQILTIGSFLMGSFMNAFKALLCVFSNLMIMVIEDWWPLCAKEANTCYICTESKRPQRYFIERM